MSLVLIIISSPDGKSAEILRQAGHAVTVTGGPSEIGAARFDVVLADVTGQEDHGSGLLSQIRERWSDAAVIITTDSPTLDGAIAAMRMGAVDYLSTSASGDELLAAIRRASEGLLRQAEKALVESEARYRALVDNSHELIWEVDAAGYVTFINPAAGERYGHEFGEIVGTHFTRFIHPDDLARTVRLFESAVTGGETVISDRYRVLNKHGETVVVDAHSIVRRDAQGTVTGVLGTAKDVTQQERSEKELRDAFESLRRSETRFRRIVEDQTEFIVRWRPDGTRTFVNESYCRYYGLSREQALGTSFFPLISEVDREGVRDRLASLTPDSPVAVGEHRVILPDGTIGWNYWTDRALFDEDGNLVEYQSVGRDITDRKRAEQSLQDALEELRALQEKVEAENMYLREKIRHVHHYGEIVSEGREMKRVLSLAGQVAATDSTVLILGETGTGKELLARAIHSLSDRSDKPLVVVNCAAMPAELVESELFGHEKGAFTGAVNQRAGRFEIADGGTIMLDEVAELPGSLQGKLLRVLQEGRFDRVGGERTISVDVRVIAATNKDLAAMVADGQFREDLYYRLNVFPLTLPPLRNRPEAIPVLVRQFVDEFNERMGKRVERVPQKSMDSLMQYSWPGNIRELRNLVERAMIQARGETLPIAVPRETPPPGARNQSLRAVEREHILGVLKDAEWRVRGRGGAAETLAMHPSTLESRMKKLGIERPR